MTGFEPIPSIFNRVRYAFLKLLNYKCIITLFLSFAPVPQE